MFSRSTPLVCAALATVTLFSMRPACADELLAGGNLQSLIVQDSKSPGQTAGKSPSKKELKGFLTAAGFEPKDLGNDMFQIEVKSGNWTFPAIVELSRDERNLWLTMSLKTVPDESRIPADKLLGLLAANQKYGPSFFEYSPKTKRFHLGRVQPNVDMTPEKFAAITELQAKVAIETESLWNSEKWAAAPAAKQE